MLILILTSSYRKLSGAGKMIKIFVLASKYATK